MNIKLLKIRHFFFFLFFISSEYCIIYSKDTSKNINISLEINNIKQYSMFVTVRILSRVSIDCCLNCYVRVIKLLQKTENIHIHAKEKKKSFSNFLFFIRYTLTLIVVRVLRQCCVRLSRTLSPVLFVEVVMFILVY